MEGLLSMTCSNYFSRTIYSEAFYYDVHVYVPEGEELDQVVADYTKMGFPGCVGSTKAITISFIIILKW